jgi:hypothetical protein
MPWTSNDAERHTHKATTTELKELWAKVANESLENDRAMRAALSGKQTRWSPDKHNLASRPRVSRCETRKNPLNRTKPRRPSSSICRTNWLAGECGVRMLCWSHRASDGFSRSVRHPDDNGERAKPSVPVWPTASLLFDATALLGPHGRVVCSWSESVSH